MNVKFNRKQRSYIRKYLRRFQGKERVNLLGVFTAITYLIRTGCQWRMLPTYFPQTIHGILSFSQIEWIYRFAEVSTIYCYLPTQEEGKKWWATKRSIYGQPKCALSLRAVPKRCRWFQKNVWNPIPGLQNFVTLRGGWVVERTFSWLDNYRRLCRNYERYPTIAKTMVYFDSILFMLRYF